jgi:hypothetical protein
MHSSPDIITEDEMIGSCSTHGEMRNACRMLVGKLERKIPFGRHRHRWENDIKMNLKETERVCVCERGCGLVSSGYG